jgi:dolichol kinase
MERFLQQTLGIHTREVVAFPADIETELIRKSLHILIALVPMLASYHVGATLMLVAAGTMVYAAAETLRCTGHPVFLISQITTMASRERDRDRFVLGPVTLGIGAMLALLLYPDPASFVAIYALAFGDGLASVVGKLFGRIQIPYTRGKTAAGTFACFAAVFTVSYRLLPSVPMALAVAATASILEALPLKDMDNIVLPLGTGFVASLLIFIS